VKASKAAVREAATVMLVRDAPALEVFMLRRNPESVFAGGAYVFPGGAVDPDDRALGDHHRFWVAAVRETFEEAGVLLARRASDGDAVDASRDVMARLADDRLRLLSGTESFAAVLDSHDARVDLDALVPFARWITPAPSPRRFDTWFFAAAAPHGHAYEHDDFEAVASEWIRPADALARARSRDLELIYPTVRTLLVMARYASASDFLADARARWERPDPLRVMNPMQGWQLDLGTLADVEADDDFTRELFSARERFAQGVEELSCPT
jgi:8-oxo-dGTP pyrophosphatase MutT (NUDIX family)